jgi:hypothetical protein
MRLFVTLTLLLSLVACNSDSLLQRISSPTEQAEARTYIDKLRRHDYAAIESAADQSIKDDKLHAALEAMAALVPAGEPTSVKLVGAHINMATGGKTLNSTFEYEFGHRWLLINVAMKEEGTARTIVGFGVQPLTASLESQNRFTLAGKGILHYAVLAAAVCSAVLTLVALVACVRTRFERRKWLWILFILFGIGQLNVNWTTGEWSFMPVAIQAFSAAAYSELYGPWIISASLPLGAAWFLFSRRKRGTPAVAPA